MSEAQLVKMAAGIMLVVGGSLIIIMLHILRLMRAIRLLLESNAYINTEAIDLMRFGINRGYEKGVNDVLKKVSREGTNLA